MKQISRFKIQKVVESTNGRLFHVEFTKKDGSHRKMLAQLIPPKEHPKRKSPAQDLNDYILVRDFKIYKAMRDTGKTHEEATNASYRLVNLATIDALTVDKEKITVVH